MSIRIGGLPALLTIVFIILKTQETIDWDWVWVLSPLWVIAGLAVIFGLLGVFFTHSHRGW